MRRYRWLRDHMVARAALNDVGNLALDAIIRWHFGIVFERLLLYQFRLWHRICAFDQRRHARQKAEFLFLGSRLWLFVNGFDHRLRCNVAHTWFIGETARGARFIFSAQSIAFLCLARLQSACSTNSAFCAFADQAHCHHISHDNANREEPRTFF